VKAKILIWNCNKSFRTKCSRFNKDNYDILIVSECENPREVVFPKNLLEKYSWKWIGKNKNSGLCVFVRIDWKLRELEKYRYHGVSYILPVKVTAPSGAITIFAVWACRGNHHEYRYIGQVWLYLKRMFAKIPTKGVLLAGDFNSNKIWDNKRENGNHSDVIRKLQSKGIESVYHISQNESHGSETSNTLFMYRKKEKGYHIDYCFASEDVIKNKMEFNIGKYQRWIKHSDHMPLTFKMY